MTESIALFTDEELRSYLVDEWNRDQIMAYYDSTDGSGATAATVEVRESSTAIELALQRTIGAAPAEAEDVLNLTAIGKDYLFELMQAVIDLGKGWKFGVSLGGVLTVVSSAINRSIASYDEDLADVLRGRSRDLALTNGKVACFGSANAQYLPIYNVDLAAADALENLKLRKPQTWSDGRLSWTRETLEKRIMQLRGPTAIGISRSAW